MALSRPWARPMRDRFGGTRQRLKKLRQSAGAVDFRRADGATRGAPSIATVDYSPSTNLRSAEVIGVMSDLSTRLA